MTKVRTVVILVGGKGTRLNLADLPKPMVKVGKKPLLEHQIEFAKRYGIRQVYLLTSYKSDVIEGYFGNGERWGISIIYVSDPNPLGTAGALGALRARINEPFFVFYGDLMFDIDLDAFENFSKHRSSVATIVVHPNDHPYDSDLVEKNAEGIVTRFHSKPHAPENFYENMVNAAIYLLAPRIFSYIPEKSFSDFGKDVLPKLLRANETILAYQTSEYIKDIGTIERLEEVEKDFLNGKVGRLNKTNPRKAIFLDRDGVINKEVFDLCKASDFELIDGAAPAIKKINSSEYLAIVITNQPVLAKGFCSEGEIRNIHKKMDTLLGQQRAYINDLYYCPHHPDRGFAGEVSELKVDCMCRKPKPGLILKAARDHNVDLSHSFFIGDRFIDMQAGKNAGVRTVLLKTGYCGADKSANDIEPDAICDSLNDAVNNILELYK